MTEIISAREDDRELELNQERFFVVVSAVGKSLLAVSVMLIFAIAICSAMRWG